MEDLRDFKGVKAWTAAATYPDGKGGIEAEVVEAQFVSCRPTSLSNRNDNCRKRRNTR
jgi:hypothetical protein